MLSMLFLATGTEAIWVPLLIAGVGAAATSVAAATADKPDVPGIPEPEKVPTADAAAIRRQLRMRRDRAALRIDPPNTGTGLQIP